MAHGSDAKATRTTATYDPKAEEFVIHTPDFEAAKCWWVLLGVGLGASKGVRVHARHLSSL